MSGATTELSLSTAVDSDDNADYLTLGLANSLRTVDALFNNVTGHTHGGAHQGGPIGSVPGGAIADGSITSAKIADGTIQTVDLAPNSTVQVWFANGTTVSPTTTSLDSFVDMPDMVINATCNGGLVVAWLYANVLNTTANSMVQLGLGMDGSSGLVGLQTSTTTTDQAIITGFQNFGVQTGPHIFKAVWCAHVGGTAMAYGTARTLMVIEYKK